MDKRRPVGPAVGLYGRNATVSTCKNSLPKGAIRRACQISRTAVTEQFSHPPLEPRRYEHSNRLHVAPPFGPSTGAHPEPWNPRAARLTGRFSSGRTVRSQQRRARWYGLGPHHGALGWVRTTRLQQRRAGPVGAWLGLRGMGGGAGHRHRLCGRHEPDLPGRRPDILLHAHPRRGSPGRVTMGQPHADVLPGDRALRLRLRSHTGVADSQGAGQGHIRRTSR